MNSRVIGVAYGISIGFVATFVIAGLSGFNNFLATAGSSPHRVIAQNEFSDMGPESESGGVPVGPAGSDAYSGEDDDNMGPRSETGGPIEDAASEGFTTDSPGVHYAPGSTGLPGDADDMNPSSEVGAAQLSPTYKTEKTGGDAGMDAPSTETGGPASVRGGGGTSEYVTETGTPFNETDEMAPRSEVPAVQREQVAPEAEDVVGAGEGAPAEDSDASSKKPAAAKAEASKQAKEEAAKQKARKVSDPAARSKEIREAEGVETY